MTPQDTVVAIRDAKIRYLIMRSLERMRIPFTVGRFSDSICQVAKAIITDEDMTGKDERVILVKNEDDVEGAVIVTVALLNGVTRGTNAVIGVDPGLRFGLALIIDGKVLCTTSAISPVHAVRQTLRWITIIRQNLVHCSVLIRVGDGSRFFLALYLRALQRASSRVTVQIVDEHHTTLTSGPDNDRSSATIIAQREGVAVTDNRLCLERREGYIRLLKRLFGQLTGGNRLSTDEAEDILAGRRSLDEAISAVHCSKND
ncbi:MAG: hypothetical protein DRO93_09355 [Candidatus Thorarchaeota archaeon]|nr:MAG: hypothetical protein DRO93_09355 [Candidatus Thorarchaeota archaeon]